MTGAVENFIVLTGTLILYLCPYFVSFLSIMSKNFYNNEIKFCLIPPEVVYNVGKKKKKCSLSSLTVQLVNFLL